MESNPYIRARESVADDAQERNRQWWERLPMTYADWDAEDRTTTRDEVVEQFVTGNLLIRRDDFAGFAGRKVLDVGSGAGPASVLFAEAGAQVTAIDLTDAGVAMTKAHTEGLGVEVLQMDAERMSFDDDTFDHVFSWGVLHHSAHTEQAFAEVARVLKPGGTGLIMVYNRASLRYYGKGLWWLLGKRRLLHGDRLASVQRFFTDGYYHRHFTSRELRGALAAAGLAVTGTTVTHMSRPFHPRLPIAVDRFLKRHAGWLLVAEFRKADRADLPAT